LPSTRAARSSGRVTVSSVDPSEVGLLGRWVDVGVLVVVEEPEELVEPDVDARRLDHLRVPRVEHDPLGGDLGPDVLVGEQHGSRL
jgi:hypothetical protein